MAANMSMAQLRAYLIDNDIMLSPSDSNRQPKAFFVNLVEEHMQQQQNAKAKTPTAAPRTPRLSEPGSAARPSVAALSAMFVPTNAVSTPRNASSKKLPAGAVASAFAQASASKRPASNSPMAEASPATKAPPKFGIPSPFVQAGKLNAVDPGSPQSPPVPLSTSIKTPRASIGSRPIVKPIQLSPAVSPVSPPILMTPGSAFRPIDDAPIFNNAIQTPIASSAPRQQASTPKEQPAPKKSPQTVKTATSSAVQSPAQVAEPMSMLNLILLGIVAFVLSFLFFRFNKVLA